MLALEQPAEDGQGLLGAPVRDDRAVAAADDEVGALTLADLVGDDLLDDLGVVVVVDVEAAAVGQGDLAVGDAPTADQSDGVLAAHAGGAPDQGPRLVPLQRVDRGTGIGAGRRHG